MYGEPPQVFALPSKRESELMQYVCMSRVIRPAVSTGFTCCFIVIVIVHNHKSEVLVLV